MSILSCILTPDHVLVGTDTDAVGPDGSRGYRVSKLMTLPHANCVLAFRGNALFATGLFWGYQNSVIPDIEAIIEQTPRLCTMASEDLLRRAKVAPQTAGQIENADVLVAGWSSRWGRPVARVFHGDPAVGHFGAEEIQLGGYFVAPPPMKNMENAKHLGTVTDMVECARMQVARIREEVPDGAAGGTFIICRVTRGEIHTQEQCVL